MIVNYIEWKLKIKNEKGENALNKKRGVDTAEAVKWTSVLMIHNNVEERGRKERKKKKTG